MDTYRLPAQFLRALAHPARLRLLDALRDGEECVCHLTALLRQRQAYVSQQLMFLRRAGLIEDRKEGLRIYYRIKDPRVLNVLDAIDISARARGIASDPHGIAACPCPKCEAKKPTRRADGSSKNILGRGRRTGQNHGSARTCRAVRIATRRAASH
jgi:ArsR family transcriptional regulator